MNRQRLVLVLLLFLLTASAAPAQAFGELVTPISPVNLRKARDLKSASVDVIMPGEMVRVDFLRDGWYAVFRPNQTVREEAKARGFARADYFKPASGQVPAGKTATPAPAPARPAAQAPAGTEERAAAQVESAPAAEQAPAPAAGLSKGWGELRTADRQLAVRKSRDPDSEHVKTLKPGDVVKVDFLADGWYAVFDPREPVRDESQALGYSYAKFLVPTGKSVSLSPPAVIPPPRVEPRLEPVAPPLSVAPAATRSGAKAPEWGRLVSLPRRVDLSRRPSQYAGFTRSLEPGTTVRVDAPANGWVAVFDPAQVTNDPSQAWGYAPESALEAPAPISATTPASIPSREPVRTSEPASPAPAVPAVPAQASAPSSPARTPAPTVNPFAIRRPEKPTADKVLHGFRYGIFDVDEERSGDIGVIELKVYLDVNVLPSPEEIADLATSIWKEKRQSGKELVVDVYLPDTDVNGLAYAVGRFNARGLVEFWTRRTILYGTRFLH